jgi:RNA polymerase sigma factor for flagellar operon FliA
MGVTATPFGYAEAQGDQTLDREQLILKHLPQVRWIAMRIHERLPATFSLEDLISTGVIGLINAIDSFDPAFNASLKTYAEYKIRGAILDSIRGLDGIPAHKRKYVKQVEAAMHAAERRLGRTPTDEDIAAELKMPIAQYHEWLFELRGVSIGSLDSAPDGGVSLLNFVSDSEEKSPMRQVERAALEKLIAEGLSRLPEPERIVLTLYYKEEQNMRDIAPILDLHLTRISQLKSQGILRLRAYMAKHWPTDRGVY